MLDNGRKVAIINFVTVAFGIFSLKERKPSFAQSHIVRLPSRFNAFRSSVTRSIGALGRLVGV